MMLQRKYSKRLCLTCNIDDKIINLLISSPYTSETSNSRLNKESWKNRSGFKVSEQRKSKNYFEISYLLNTLLWSFDFKTLRFPKWLDISVVLNLVMLLLWPLQEGSV